MPWSEWQQPETLSVSPDLLGVDWVGDAPGTADTSTYVLRGVGPGPSDDEARALQVTAAGDWDTRRNDFPDLLNTLEYGVDYAETPDDPSQFVQYDDGPNAMLGWDVGDFTAAESFDDGGASSGSFTIGFEAGRVFVVTGQPIETFPGAPPNVFATWGPSTPAGTPLGSPNPGTALAFSVWGDAVIASGLYLSMRADRGSIAQRVLQPRWRYWIPGNVAPIPLRQRQRDDGLGSSTRRARGGTSRQRSIRQRGYV